MVLPVRVRCLEDVCLEDIGFGSGGGKVDGDGSGGGESGGR